jgi:1-acyl-sn-glycerol-3-phosphate acyltransferase
VPIVPVAISGAYEVWPRGKSFFQSRHPVTLSFGDPIYPHKSRNPSEEDYTAITAELRKRVVDMWASSAAENKNNKALSANR